MDLCRYFRIFNRPYSPRCTRPLHHQLALPHRRIQLVLVRLVLMAQQRRQQRALPVQQLAEAVEVAQRPHPRARSLEVSLEVLLAWPLCSSRPCSFYDGTDGKQAAVTTRCRPVQQRCRRTWTKHQCLEVDLVWLSAQV